MELPPELSFAAIDGLQVRIDDKATENYRVVEMMHQHRMNRHAAVAGVAPITAPVFSWHVRFKSLNAAHQWVQYGITSAPNPAQNYGDATCCGGSSRHAAVTTAYDKHETFDLRRI